MATRKNKKFPTFALIVFILAILWILTEIKILTINIPWFPVIIAAIALSWILDFYKNKK